jgi:hypothetical protein
MAVTIKYVDDYHIQIDFNEEMPTDSEAYIDLKTIDKITGDNTEFKHIYMDEYLCKLLIGLGYPYLVSAFNNTYKWYS